MSIEHSKDSIETSTGSRQRGFYPVLVVMLLLFAGVVAQRHRLRAHWWGIQLSSASTTQEKADCIARIADQGAQGYDVLFSLANDRDAEVRRMLLAVLAGLRVSESADAYRSLLSDSNDEVRETAALDLAFRNEAGAIDLLTKMAHGNQHEASLTAITALRRVGTASAIACLSEIATSSTDPKRRAQAVESLLIWIDTHGRDLLLHPTEPGVDVRPPIESALLSALNDDTEFKGLLGFEREIAAVGEFLGGATETPLDDIAPDASRRIGEFARVKLAEAIGKPQIENKTQVTRAGVVDIIDRWMTTPRLPQPALPDGIDLPD